MNTSKLIKEIEKRRKEIVNNTGAWYTMLLRIAVTKAERIVKGDLLISATSGDISAKRYTSCIEIAHDAILYTIAPKVLDDAPTWVKYMHRGIALSVQESDDLQYIMGIIRRQYIYSDITDDSIYEFYDSLSDACTEELEYPVTDEYIANSAKRFVPYAKNISTADGDYCEPYSYNMAMLFDSYYNSYLSSHYYSGDSTSVRSDAAKYALCKIAKRLATLYDPLIIAVYELSNPFQPNNVQISDDVIKLVEEDPIMLDYIHSVRYELAKFLYSETGDLHFSQYICKAAVPIVKDTPFSNDSIKTYIDNKAMIDMCSTNCDGANAGVIAHILADIMPIMQENDAACFVGIMRELMNKYSSDRKFTDVLYERDQGKCLKISKMMDKLSQFVSSGAYDECAEYIRIILSNSVSQG